MFLVARDWDTQLNSITEIPGLSLRKEKLVHSSA